MGLIAEIHKDLENGALQLIVEYHERLHVLATQMCGDETQAEDLVFRTFERVLTKAKTYKSDTNLFGWMKSIMENIHKDDLKRPVARNTTAVEAEELEQIAGADWSTDEQVIRNSDSEALRAALRDLPPEYRQTVILRFYEDLSLKEIASFLNKPVGTVGRRIHVALRLLSGKLSAEMGKAKKPLAVLLAALLGVCSLFGAWQAGLLAPFLAPSVETPQSVEANQRGEAESFPLQEETVSTQAEPPPATDLKENQVTQEQVNTKKAEGEDAMNGKKLMMAAVAASAAVGAMADYTPIYRGLPKDYTQVAYVQSSGTQYIDLKINAQSGLSLETDMSWVELPSDAAYCAAKTPTQRIYLLWYSSGWMFGYGQLVKTFVTATANEIYHIESALRNGSQTATAVNSTGSTELDWANSPAATGDIDLETSLYLFAYNQGNVAGNKCKARCYALKIWQDDGAGGRDLVGDFVPCLNKSGAAGLYDLVTEEFFAPSAALSYGEPVPQPIDPSPYDGNVYVGAEREGEWSVAANWSYGHVPTDGEDVFIVDRTVSAAGSLAVKSLTIKEGGFLKVQAPAAANPKNFATVYPSACKLNVTETFRIERGGTFQPITDVLTGNPVFVNCADFVLEEGGQIEASAMGYGWAPQTGVDFAALDALGHVYVKQNDGYSYCPGAGTSYSSTASYGAKGSRVAYGYAYAPWLSGGVSGLYNKYATNEKQWAGWARGGGAVVIFASGAQTIAGDIWANGAYRFYNGSAGGGIWLVANSFKFYSMARFNANGSSDNYAASNKGGRISLGAGLTAAHVSNLVTGQAPAQVSLAYGDNLDFINAHTYGGLSSTDAMIIDRTRTEAGTRTYTVNTNALTLVAVKGVGVRGAERIGGLLSVNPAALASFGVEELKGADESAVHYAASGWRLLDGETVVASGTGQTASWTLAEKYPLLTLEWTIASITKDPEPDFFADVPAGTGAEKTFVGEDGGAWDEAGSWSPAGVPGLTDSVTLEGKTVYAEGVIGAASLTVASDAKLVVGGKGADVLAEAATDGARFGLKVTGDAAIAGEVSFGGKDLTAPLRVAVGGNLTLSGSAVLAVYATRASTPDFATLYAEATPVAVAGKLTLNDTSRIVPDSDYLTGASVRFTAGSVEIAEGAKFDATGRGWGWTTKTGEFSHDIRDARYTVSAISTAHLETYAPGSGGRLPSESNASGAGYGGLGDRASVNSGRAYGYQYAPFLPGSCGFAQASRGAGVIWIECGGQFTLNGALDATGSSLASGHANTSGGGIWVSAMGFAAGSQARLLASGGSTSGSSYGAAGGRIALLLATSAEDRDALARGETPEGLTYDSAIAGVPTVTVAGGAGSYSSGTTPYMAANGTLATVRGTVKVPTVHVTGDPLEAVGPTYGDIATSLGATVSFTAPEYGTDPNAASVRYTCQGYLATNAVGDVVAQDTGRSASFTVADDDVYFTWIWGDRETSMDVVVPPGGTVTYGGTTYTENFSIWAAEGGELEAVPAQDYEFLYWLGDVPAGCERQAKFALPGGVYRSVTPVFRPAEAPATRTWLGGTGGWTDPAMWDGGVIPGLADTVVVESGVCLVSNYVACANLTVGGAAKLLAGCVLQSGKTTVVPTYPNASTLPYAGTAFERAAVELSGALTVGGSAEMAVGANGQTVYPQVEANDISLEGSAKLYLTAGPRTAALTYDTGTGFLNVAGDLSIADTARLYLRSDSYSGGSMVTTVGGALTVAAGAAVTANDGGFWVDISKDPQSLEPLPQFGGGDTYNWGASHGGVGTRGKVGCTYDFRYAPRMPGSTTTPSYQNSATTTAPGGGVIRIHARRAKVAGVMTATTSVNDKWCASAGGTIWLTADDLQVESGASFAAQGGRNLYGGKGGGGRISICRGLTDAEFAAILADGDTLPPGRFSRSARSTARHVLDAVAFTNVFKGVTVDVSGAQAGTFVFLEGRGPGMMVLVK